MKVMVSKTKLQIAGGNSNHIMVLPSNIKIILDQARKVWIECYILWCAFVCQIVAIATPYWAIHPSGHSGLWVNCHLQTCIGVFENGDPEYWLRCVQIVITIALPLTLLSGLLMVLVSFGTNTRCAAPAYFSCITSGFMVLLGSAFYGYHQNELTTIGWSLLLSVIGGCFSIACSTRMFLGCLKREDTGSSSTVYHQECPVNL